jgi:hypothetical protein
VVATNGEQAFANRFAVRCPPWEGGGSRSEGQTWVEPLLGGTGEHHALQTRVTVEEVTMSRLGQDDAVRGANVVVHGIVTLELDEGHVEGTRDVQTLLLRQELSGELRTVDRWARVDVELHSAVAVRVVVSVAVVRVGGRRVVGRQRRRRRRRRGRKGRSRRPRRRPRCLRRCVGKRRWVGRRRRLGWSGRRTWRRVLALDTDARVHRAAASDSSREELFRHRVYDLGIVLGFVEDVGYVVDGAAGEGGVGRLAYKLDTHPRDEVELHRELTALREGRDHVP